jgi:uncharacterized membrane protein YtjA (UPF0391 family)
VFDPATVTSLATVGQPLQLFSGEFLQYAIVFFVLAILATLVGARGVAGITMEIARIFVLIFLVLAIISVVL